MIYPWRNVQQIKGTREPSICVYQESRPLTGNETLFDGIKAEKPPCEIRKGSLSSKPKIPLPLPRYTARAFIGHTHFIRCSGNAVHSL